jgi:hypothetical protein
MSEDTGLTIQQGPMAVITLDRLMSPELVIELMCCIGVTLRIPVKDLEDLSEAGAEELKTFGYTVEEVSAGNVANNEFSEE